MMPIHSPCIMEGIIIPLLILLVGFYLVGVPVWLISLSGKIRSLEEELFSKEKTPAAPKPKLAATTPAKPIREPVVAPIIKKSPAIPRTSFEEQVGGHLLQWLGIGALIIALAVFLKWSFDNGFIGETGRTVLGYIFAAGGIVAGDVFRTKYKNWALAFTGGGALAAYIVTWIAANTYHLFGTGTAFAIFCITAAIVCLLSIRYGAVALAGFGIAGGFLTPILAGSEGTSVGLLSYVLILDLAILGLAHFRQWRNLNALTCVGTILYEIVTIDKGDMTLGTGLFFVSTFTTIYLLIPAVYNIMEKQKSEQTDLIIFVGSGIAHFAITLWWLQTVSDATREFYDVVVALTFAVLFLFWSMGLYARNKTDTPMVLGGLSLTVLFATLAIPMQLGAEWTSVAWSMEAAFLLWISLTLKDSRIQNFAWPVMAAAYVWYFVNPLEDGSSLMFQDAGFLIFLLWVVMFVGIAWTGLGREKSERGASQLLPFALVGGAVLVVGLVFSANSYQSQLSIIERFIQAISLVGGSYVVLFKAKSRWADLTSQEQKAFTYLGIAAQIVTVGYLTFEFRDAIQDRRIFQNSERQYQIMAVGTSILWAAYASLTLVIGIVRNWKSIRLFSLILLLIAIAKLTLVDFSSLGTGARVIGFTVLGALLVAASFLYQHNKNSVKSFFVSSDASK